MSHGHFICGLFDRYQTCAGAAMKRPSLVGRTARYTIVGTICAASNNVLMIFGDLAGVHYLPMMFLSFAIVTPLGYLLHAGFTFGGRLALRGLLRFALGAAAGFPLSLLIVAILCTGLGVRVAIAVPIATVIIFVWNYTSAHWAIMGRAWFFEHHLKR